MSGPLECHPYRLRERKKELRYSCLDDDGVDTGKKTENDARNNEAATEGDQALCTPIERSWRSFEGRVGPETAVPLLEQARVFAAMEAEENSLSHACASSKECMTCAARRVARLLRVHRTGEAKACFLAFTNQMSKS